MKFSLMGFSETWVSSANCGLDSIDEYNDKTILLHDTVRHTPPGESEATMNYRGLVAW